MIETLNQKKLQILAPQANQNNAAQACNVIDTNGFDYCDIDVYWGATDIGATTMKILESDVKASATTLTSGTLVPGSDYSVSPATLPDGNADNFIFGWHINLNGPRKRYLLLALTVGSGTTSFVIANAVLSRADQKPKNAATRGYSQELLC